MPDMKIKDCNCLFLFHSLKIHTVHVDLHHAPCICVAKWLEVVLAVAQLPVAALVLALGEAGVVDADPDRANIRHCS